MEKIEINKLNPGQMAPGDKVLGYSTAQDVLVLFPIQTEDMAKHIEIHADNNDIYMRSNTVDLSCLRVQILRKKKRSSLRSFNVPEGSKHPHPVRRMSGWRWSKYFSTIGKNNGEIGFIPFVPTDNSWYKLNLLDYLFFVKRDRDAANWFEEISYSGCPISHKYVTHNKPKIYQILGLRLIDSNDNPCSDIIQIRHRISLTKILQEDGTYSDFLCESFTLK